MLSLSFCFFFFSSRRRHTRFDCDWSSDVCSSDLRHAPLPVLKPNEAMIEEAVQGQQGALGLISSFAPTLQSMPPEFPAGIELVPALADGAIDALNRGDTATHDRLAVEQATGVAARRCPRLA